MNATTKFTAYGAVLVAALVMGLALTTASAAPTAGDVAVTITGTTTQTLTAIDANRGQLTAAAADGTYSIVTQPASGGTVAVSSQTATANVLNTTSAAIAVVDTTIAMTGTTDFPSSGLFYIDSGNDVADTTADPAGGVQATDEIVNCTGITSTSLTGCTRGVGNTTSQVQGAGGVNVIPIAAYSVISISPFAANDGSVNLAAASDFATSGQVIALPAIIANAEALVYTGKSGNSLTGTGAPPVVTHPVGTDIIQFGRTFDTAIVTITVDAGFAGALTYVYDYDLVSANGNVTVTVIGDNPVANDVEVTVAATLPTPLPVIVNLNGTDSSAKNGVGGAAGLTLATLPAKGLLSALPTPTTTCTDVTGAVIGEVLTNCSTSLVYTPLAGASGVDTFTYTIANGGDTSAVATVTIILPGGSSTTPGAGFSTPIVAGVNFSTYLGGSVAQLSTDAGTAGAVSVSVTDAGAFVTLIVGAPDFVNAAFNALFPTGVPAGQIVLVVITS